ncbi:MAG: hypothetical protein Q4G64_09335 [bacterium]|nr:hypothetical protein [bacterium]
MSSERNGEPENAAHEQEAPQEQEHEHEAPVAQADAVPAPGHEHAPEDAPAPEPVPTPEPIQVRHRRAPRYGRFVAFGLLLFGVIAFVIAFITRGWSGLAASDSFWLLMLYLGPAGMLLGALTAFILDRRSAARMDRQTIPETPTGTPHANS